MLSISNNEPLNSARLKLSRAYKLFVELESDIKFFAERKPYRFVREREANTGDELLVYYPTEESPLWSVIIGDILHNLRCSLDHAVYGLSVSCGDPEILKRCAFPIFADEDAFFGRKGNPKTSGIAKIAGLTQKAQDCVVGWQSYPRTGPDQITHLEILDRLENIDKHRKLQVVGVGSKIFTFTNPYLIPLPGLITTLDGINLEKPAVVARWRFTTEEDSKMEVSADASFEIAFDARNLEIFQRPEPVLKMLYILVSTTDKVLNDLKATISHTAPPPPE